MAGDSQETPFSVSALAAAIKGNLESGFSHKFVEGEISGWRPYPSGHVYFTLKDAGAQIPAVMFKGNFMRCKARDRLREGVKALVYATATFYPDRGRCQLVVLDAKIAGEGDLMQRYLELKAALAAEGLFDQSRKRNLPAMPRRIAMATSPAGAVVHDMCRTIARRFPRVQLRVFACSVQGDGAAAEIAAALDRIYAAADGWVPDLVIVARGGGSFEDLFCFNDEALVRKVAASPFPIVSAVGHETDYTLCDFAADVRAGTPSIAAEMAVPELQTILLSLERSRRSMASSLGGRYAAFAQFLDAAGDRLAAALKNALAAAQDRLRDASSARLAAALNHSLSAAQAYLREVSSARLAAAARQAVAVAQSSLRETCAKLALLSPFSVLERGYSLATAKDGRIVKSAGDVREGEMLDLRLAHGSLEVEVEKTSISLQ